MICFCFANNFITIVHSFSPSWGRGFYNVDRPDVVSIRASPFGRPSFVHNQLIPYRQTNPVLNNWKWSDFLSNDQFLDERIGEILARRRQSNGGQLNFSNEDEVVNFVAMELTNMAIFRTGILQQESRRIMNIPHFLLAPLLIFHVRKKIVDRLENCSRPAVLNFLFSGCRLSTTTTTTTTTPATTAITTAKPSLRNIIYFALIN